MKNPANPKSRSEEVKTLYKHDLNWSCSVLDADWEPEAAWENPARAADPVWYHQRCLRRWERQDRRRGQLVRRCLAAAAVLFASAVLFALLAG